jgi:hypothetical protein
MKRINRTERHVRWNWEESQERDADNHNYVRYHFVVVDDRDREGLMNQLTSRLSMYSEVIEVRSCEGRVAESKLRYLYKTFDCVTKPDMIDWSSLNKPIKKDRDLRERKRGNVEDYVAGVYS